MPLCHPREPFCTSCDITFRGFSPGSAGAKATATNSPTPIRLSATCKAPSKKPTWQWSGRVRMTVLQLVLWSSATHVLGASPCFQVRAQSFFSFGLGATSCSCTDSSDSDSAFAISVVPSSSDVSPSSRSSSVRTRLRLEETCCPGKSFSWASFLLRHATAATGSALSKQRPANRFVSSSNLCGDVDWDPQILLCCRTSGAHTGTAFQEHPGGLARGRPRPSPGKTQQDFEGKTAGVHRFPPDL